MTERPILFSAPMVRALLAGTKTQTRRIVKDQNYPNYCKPPYGAAGDRLWVRETIKLDEFGDAVFAADGVLTVIDTWCWQRPVLPSIHMPRGARRIVLEIVDVRVQRLQDIDGYDVVAEGIDLQSHRCDCEACRMTSTLCPATQTSLGLAYGELWDSINGDRAPWSSNPWVWAITFKRIDTTEQPTRGGGG